MPGLLAVENAAGVDADLAIHVRNTSPVAHQSTTRNEVTPMIDRRHLRAAACRRALASANGADLKSGSTSGFSLCVQPVSATPLVVYRLAFGSPRSFADVD